MVAERAIRQLHGLRQTGLGPGYEGRHAYRQNHEEKGVYNMKNKCEKNAGKINKYEEKGKYENGAYEENSDIKESYVFEVPYCRTCVLF